VGSALDDCIYHKSRVLLGCVDFHMGLFGQRDYIAIFHLSKSDTIPFNVY
jgi:hypothetical protein